MLLHSPLRKTPIQPHRLIQNYLAQFGLIQADYPVGEELELDEQILAAIERFDATVAHAPGTCNTQARYLAEEIYLAHYRHNQDLEVGVIKFIETFVRLNYPSDVQKQHVADSVCREIRSHQSASSPQAKALYELFANRFKLPILDAWTGDTLQAFGQNNGDTAVRCGDVVVLPPDAEIFVIGDSHGDPQSMRTILNAIKQMAQLDGSTSAKRPYVVFLGDYVNNGLDSVGNLVEILRFREANPGHVILLSGNHEYHETLYAALNEFFNVHWNNATQNPFAGKLPPHHYGHVRLEFIRKFGVTEGEKLYSAFVAWGARLPYVCFGADGLMLSHSVGKASSITGPVTFADMLYAKRDDALCIKQSGFGVCKQRHPSQHTAMVGNRVIDAPLLDAFSALGVTHVVVGHSHYRSGDITHNAPMLITLCASHPQSPDAGHYIYQEMDVNRARRRDQEALPPGSAYPCYVSFAPTQGPNRTLKMKVHPITLKE